MNKMKRVYFARSNYIVKMGPYTSDVEAWAALRGHDGLPVENAQVWVEESVNDTYEADKKSVEKDKRLQTKREVMQQLKSVINRK
jgi:hypothetical protein